MKKAFITGIAGQDGSYLAEFLLAKGYEVYGLDLASSENPEKQYPHINHLLRDNKITLHRGDIKDFALLHKLLREIQPDEIYHLAGQTNSVVSFEDELGTFQDNFQSVHNLLSIIKN